MLSDALTSLVLLLAPELHCTTGTCCPAANEAAEQSWGDEANFTTGLEAFAQGQNPFDTKRRKKALPCKVRVRARLQM